MRYHRRPSWRLPESAATPEAAFWNRRTLLAAAGLGAAATAIGGRARAAEPGDPFVPAPPRNPAFTAGDGRALTDAEEAGTYNNFYEFGSHKQIWRAARKLDVSDWRVAIDGMVETPLELDMDDIIARMPLEERVTRHRCVEAWSMVVPWIGFELNKLLALAAPLSGAKFVRFESFHNPAVASGQRQTWYPWPYVEGLTIAEAANPLAFMVVGVYGAALPQQYGAPVRLHTPWKYGFKSSKSITRITLTDAQPLSFWEELQNREYGFWANVNPDVAHPRWSQATEKVLGTNERIPTQMFNGYGEEVAGLYSGLSHLGDALYR